MKVCVLGARGLVGTYLRIQLKEMRHEIVCEGDIEDADVSNPGALRALLGGSRPDWVVNLAAWTNVDGCESDRARAETANGTGAGNVAQLASDCNARMLQVSTDYVFDGAKNSPYVEEDRPHPISVYGKSKLIGEELVQRTLPAGQWLIVRGQSLYGKGGKKSFPDAIWAKAHSPGEIPVVTDQTVQPTWAQDFAQALVLLMERGASGLVHFAATGYCTWNQFARTVVEICGGQAKVTDITATALNRPARRPAWSVFDTARYEALTGRKPRTWEAMIQEYPFWQESQA